MPALLFHKFSRYLQTEQKQNFIKTNTKRRILEHARGYIIDYLKYEDEFFLISVPIIEEHHKYINHFE